jgi:hypothetical protein
MNKKLIALSAAFAVIVPLTSVLAEDNEPTNSSYEENKKISERQREENKRLMENNREQNKQEMEKQREENKQKMEALREGKKQERCKNTEERITTRINRFEEGHSMFQTVFGKMKARLERLVTRLDAAEADTTKLKTDLQTLYGKIDKLTSDYNAFIAGLKETQPLTCGQSEGEFKGKLGEARKQLPQIIQERKEIRTFFQETIKADLMEIRKQLGITREENKAEKESENERNEDVKNEKPELTN